MTWTTRRNRPRPGGHDGLGSFFDELTGFFGGFIFSPFWNDRP